MLQKLSEYELKELANHLRCPNGTKGLEVAQMMNATNGNLINKTIAALGLTGNDSVLEIGPGNGLHVKSIFNTCAIKSYTGADMSASMVNEAARINADNTKANFILTNGKALPFNNDTFDKVFTANTIYFWENAQDYLNEICRVLKQKGTITITYIPERVMQKIPFSKFGFTHYKESDVTRLLENSGFKVMSEITENEIVISKAGDKIEREFVIITGKKL